MRPGAMQLTVMPSAATCMERALDQLAIAAFAGVAAFIRLSAACFIFPARHGDKRLQQCEAFDHDASLTLLQ
jgi:hypothetical protein